MRGSIAPNPPGIITRSLAIGRRFALYLRPTPFPENRQGTTRRSPRVV